MSRITHSTRSRTSLRPRSRRARRFAPAALAAGLLATGLTAGNVGAGSTPAEPAGDVTLLDAGDPSYQVVLPGTPTVGQAGISTKQSRTSGTVSSTGASTESVAIDVTTDIVQAGVVTAVNPDGTFVLNRRVDSYDVTNESDPGEGDSYADDEELQVLLGVELQLTGNSQGSLLDVAPATGVVLTPDQEAAVAEVLADGAGNTFPAEPVGVGAQWEAELSGGGALSAVYTLTALDGDAFTVEVAIEADATAFLGGDLPEGFDSASGTITGTGVFSGIVGNPFERTTQITSDIDIILIGSGMEVTTDMTIVETQTTVSA